MSLKQNLRKHSLVIVLVILYIMADMVLTFQEIYLLNLLPLVVLVIYLALARIDIIYFIIVALTPLSIQLLEFFPGSSH